MVSQAPEAVQLALMVVLVPSDSTYPAPHVTICVSSYQNVPPVGSNSALSTVKASHCTSVRDNHRTVMCFVSLIIANNTAKCIFGVVQLKDDRLRNNIPLTSMLELLPCNFF